MPAINPTLTPTATQAVATLGRAIHERRRALRISAVAAAEAAGISRVTLHRIEKGVASVTVGAYAAVCGALGLTLETMLADAANTAPPPDRKGWIPARVRLADYPRLQELAWQVHGTPELTPREALDIYERNWRHLDPGALAPDERNLVDALREALGSAAGV